MAAPLIDNEAVLNASTAIADTMSFPALVMAFSRFAQREDRPAAIESSTKSMSCDVIAVTPAAGARQHHERSLLRIDSLRCKKFNYDRNGCFDDRRDTR